MQKKFLIICVLVTLVALSASFTVVLAKNSSQADEQILPEVEGVYDVPGQPKLKLRVFVYKAKATPGATTPPSLVCSLADDNTSTSTPAWTGWKLPSAWTYSLNLSSVPATVGGSNLRTMARDAFDRWTAASRERVNLTEISTNTKTRAVRDGLNIITWSRTSGSALAVTYTWYIPSTGEVVENDTIMNKKFTWYWSDPASWSSNPNNTPGATCAYQGVYDAQDILTHELGHWFGLNDHYTGDYANNTMYGYGSKTETKKDTLTNGDISGIQAIYP
jgi:hypothetical protein